MPVSKSLIRQSHFLGTKIRNLRKNNHLTMDDLSSRCIRINPDYAPSVSYLSMIERGKRVPSEAMLEVIAEVFQKDLHWFLDDEPGLDATIPNKGNRGVLMGWHWSQASYFPTRSYKLRYQSCYLKPALPEGQFAHLLIRAHQEKHQNHFPDLERAAEEVGLKQLNHSVSDLTTIAKRVGLDVRWVDRAPAEVTNELGLPSKQLITSFMEPNGTVFLNRRMEDYPTRLKYDLSVYIGHQVLHNGGVDNLLSVGLQDHWNPNKADAYDSELSSKDILQAWRDFESSFSPEHCCVQKYHLGNYWIVTAMRLMFMKKRGYLPLLQCAE